MHGSLILQHDGDYGVVSQLGIACTIMLTHAMQAA